MTIDATLGTSGTTGAHDASHGDASPEEFHVQAVAAHAPGNALAGTGYVAGIDLGGTKILAAIFSPDGSIVSRAKVVTGRTGGIDVVERMAAAVREAAKVARLDLSQVAAVGTGVPAPVDPVTGVVHMTPNIDGWEDMPLKQELGGRLDGIPVAIDNDVRVAVIAEHGAGAGVGIRNMVGIWPGTGVGGGLILDGRIYTGSSSYAGEIGHITIKEGGAPCGCGGRGHLEAYCSRTAIVKHLEKLVRDGKKTRLTRIVGRDLLRAKSSDLAEAAALGDAVVVSVLDRTARYLAIGIASIANLLNPEMIVLGGGVVEALGDDFVENVAKRVRREPFRATTGPLKIVASALGDDAGITGAAIIARQMQVGLHP
jgi:glucokinase